MPCYSMRRTPVVMPVATVTKMNTTRLKTLKKALESLGLTVTDRNGVLSFTGMAGNQYMRGIYRNGQFEVSQGVVSLNQIKQAMSQVILKRNARKFGWEYRATKGGGIARKGDDIVKVSILPDGSIKTVVPGSVSAPNHSNAEAFLNNIQSDAGGKTINLGSTSHHAEETHTHSDGTTHTH